MKNYAMFVIDKVSILTRPDNVGNATIKRWSVCVKLLFLPLLILNSLFVGQQIEKKFTVLFGGTVETDAKIHRSLRSGNFDNQYVDEMNMDDLWYGRVSEERMKYERQKNKWPKVSLAVAHCDLPVDWIWNYFLQNGVEFESVHIYSKCGKPLYNLPPEATIVNLPNVGRNDHSFAYHMNHLDYTNHTDDDIVFFMKDNMYRLIDHDQFFNSTEKRSMSTLIDIASVNGFGCLEQPLSLLNIYPSYYFEVESLKRFFNKEAYVRIERDKESTDVPFASEYESFKDWKAALNITLQTPYTPVCMGGMFSTTISQIKRHKSLWKTIEKKLSRGDNIEEGHFAERSWAGLLSKPLSQEAIKKLKNKATHSLCDEFPWGDRCGTLAYTVNGTEPLEPEYTYDDDDTESSVETSEDINETSEEVNETSEDINETTEE